ncbi:MAG: SpoIIE family protein phosphatase [Chloroflexi bacterium]|nr:SpoIIE family protein phosphatase [Chloroflexota bacterium]
MRPPLPRLIFSFAVGLLGLGVLVLLTDGNALRAHLLPILFFTLLSFIVKRAGVYSGPDTLHSLVGIVDLAAIFIFGPLTGAWVPAMSSLLYILINNLEYGRRNLIALFESPIFNAGLKALMGIASGSVFMALGGALPPLDFGIVNLLPSAAAMLVWFGLDNLGWAIWETMRIGARGFFKLFRDTLGASLVVELAPLPFSMVIAVVYTEFGGLTRPIFILLAGGLVLVAFVIQRYAIIQDRLQRHTRELAALNEFNQAVAHAGFDADRVIELLLDYTRRVLNADLVRVELFSADRDALTVRAEARGDALHWQREVALLSPALVFMRDNPASLVADDLRQRKLPFEFDARFEHRLARSALFVPLLAGEDVSGMVTVLSARSRALGMTNARTLNVLAGQAGVAIENTRLYAVERRRATQLAIVSDVSGKVAQVLELEELLPKVAHEIQDRFGYTHVHVLVEQENRDLLFFASTHPLGEAWRQRGERMRYQEGIIGWVAAHAEPLLVPDVTKEPRYAPGPDNALSDTRSELGVPLIIGQRVVGVLDVQSDRTGAFNDEDLFVMRTLGAQIAIAIENSRLFEAQQVEAYYLNTLLNVAENLADQESLADALTTIVTLTTLLVGVKRAAVFMYHPVEREFRAGKAYGLSPRLLRRFERLRFPLAHPTHNVFTELWNTREPVAIGNARTSDLIRPQLAELFELEAVVLFPLIARGEMVGALGVDQGRDAQHFSPEEMRVLTGIANQAAVAIERAQLDEQAEQKKRLDHELGLARQIQTSFLPHHMPHLPGYDIAATWRAAREVSGDFYDLIRLQHERLGMVVADVSDKGLPAALFMALTRTIIRTMAIGKPSPREAMERANDVIIADAQSDMFVTAFYGVLDTTDGSILYVNAGHNPPLLYHYESGTVHPLPEHGIALGILPNMEQPQAHVQLHPGDVIVLYTDGITDALDLSGEQEFGAPRLVEVIQAHASKSAQALTDEIMHAVQAFTQGAPQFDDLTLVVVKRKLEIGD